LETMLTDDTVFLVPGQPPFGEERIQGRVGRPDERRTH
jgi:hypothetical protein